MYNVSSIEPEPKNNIKSLVFDYASLEPEHADYLQTQARRVYQAEANILEQIRLIGSILIDVYERLPKLAMIWVRQELGYSNDKDLQYRQIAQNLTTLPSELGASYHQGALAYLARPSVAVKPNDTTNTDAIEWTQRALHQGVEVIDKDLAYISARSPQYLREGLLEGRYAKIDVLNTTRQLDSVHSAVRQYAIYKQVKNPAVVRALAEWHKRALAKPDESNEGSWADVLQNGALVYTAPSGAEVRTTLADATPETIDRYLEYRARMHYLNAYDAQEAQYATGTLYVPLDEQLRTLLALDADTPNGTKVELTYRYKKG